MKILIHGNLWHGSMEQSYARAFKLLGCEVVFFDPNDGDMSVYSSSTLTLWQRAIRKLKRGPLHKPRVEMANRRFVSLARKTQPDMVWVFKGVDLTPRWVQRLRENVDGPVLVYDPDNPFIESARHWSRNVIACIPLYDCHLVYGKFLIPLLLQHKARRVEHIPCAYDPELFGPVPTGDETHPEFECDIAFVGTWDAEREHWLSLLAQRFRVSIWGNEWEHCQDPRVASCWKRKPVYGQDFARVCRTAKLSFNYVRTENNRSSHNMRTFEIPACGGLAFTNRTEEQTAFFKEDEEMVCFDSESELLSKASSLLENPDRIRVMKRQALAAGRAHTYQKRAATICDIAQDLSAKTRSTKCSEEAALRPPVRTPGTL